MARFESGLTGAAGELLAGRLDASFGRFAGLDPVLRARLEQQPVRYEPMAVVLPEDHRLAALDAVPLDALAGETVYAGAGNPRTPEWTDLARRLFEGRGIELAPPAPVAVGAEEFRRVMAKTRTPVLAVVDFPAMPETVLRPLVDPVPLSAGVAGVAQGAGASRDRCPSTGCGRTRGRRRMAAAARGRVDSSHRCAHHDEPQDDDESMCVSPCATFWVRAQCGKGGARSGWGPGPAAMCSARVVGAPGTCPVGGCACAWKSGEKTPNRIGPKLHPSTREVPVIGGDAEEAYPGRRSGRSSRRDRGTQRTRNPGAAAGMPPVGRNIGSAGRHGGADGRHAGRDSRRTDRGSDVVSDRVARAAHRQGRMSAIGAVNARRSLGRVTEHGVGTDGGRNRGRGRRGPARSRRGDRPARRARTAGGGRAVQQAKDAPAAHDGSDGPVFVDESGRRSRRYRRIGMRRRHRLRGVRRRHRRHPAVGQLGRALAPGAGPAGRPARRHRSTPRRCRPSRWAVRCTAASRRARPRRRATVRRRRRARA